MSRCLVIGLVFAACWSASLHAQPATALRSAMDRMLEFSAQVPPEGEPVKCGFPAMTGALRVRQSGSAELASAASVLLSRPAMQTSVVRSGFRVHFDTTGFNAPALLDSAYNALPGTARAYIDSVFACLAYVVPIETQTLGYGALPSDDTLNGGPEYDVFIMELGSMYGYTTPDGSPTDGGTASSYLTIDNDFIFVHPAKNRGIPALHVTIAHELHHALQIGNYGYWQNDVYFYEITSTWMEDVLYPAVDDYYEYLRAGWGHFSNPERPFTSNDLICYSRAVWGHYVAKRYGRDMMRTMWEQIRSAVPLTAIDNALRTRGYDAASAFAEWSLWNHFTGFRSDSAMYYPDGADYKLMYEPAFEYRPPSLPISNGLSPFASRYYQLVHAPDTMTVIVTNVDLASAVRQTAAQDFKFDFSSTKPDDSYRLTPIGLYSRLSVTNQAHWASWYVVGDTVRRNIDPNQFAEGRAFPNPYLPGTHARVAMLVEGSDQVNGAVYIYDCGTGLVYAANACASTWYLDHQMFFWDGKGSDGKLVPSGVYVYVIDIGDRRITGKIALVRR
jgi:hypothetical protein